MPTEPHYFPHVQLEINRILTMSKSKIWAPWKTRVFQGAQILLLDIKDSPFSTKRTLCKSDHIGSKFVIPNNSPDLF